MIVMEKTAAKSWSLNIQLEIQYPFKKKQNRVRITGTMTKANFQAWGQRKVTINKTLEKL